MSEKVQDLLEKRRKILEELAAEEKQARDEERKERMAQGDSEFVFEEHLKRTNPHADRPTVISAKPLTSLEGLHLIKTNDNGVIRHHLLIDDGESSTIINGG